MKGSFQRKVACGALALVAGVGAFAIPCVMALADDQGGPGGQKDTELAGTLDVGTTSRTSSAETFFGYLRIAAIVLGIVAVAALAFYIIQAIRAKKTPGVKTPGKARVIASGVIAVVMAALLVASLWATSAYNNSINAIFTKQETSDSDVAYEKDDALALANQVANEGMVLMKNDGNVLPLDVTKGAKVNLLGYSAYNPYYSGTGSGSASASDAVTILSSLESAGFEVNTAPVDAGVYSVEAPKESGMGFNTASLEVNEPSIDSFTGNASFQSMDEYSDTAIVVIGRGGGEGYDLTDYQGTDGNNYLQLSNNEKDLLAAARKNFGTVIVVLNTCNAPEVGFLDDYDVDACIWAGEPGPYGFSALGKILNGEVNPSGKLPDTWVYNNDSNPVNENFGEQAASNASDEHYIDYVEGIYVGYKWYETAYDENATVTNTKTGETFNYGDYNSVVAYPFGYGLSYTTFSEEISGGLQDGASLNTSDTVELDVTVTNTGKVAGKDVAEVYLTAPYTDYDIANGVEKSSVSLVGYQKTKLLDPGESQTLTIKIPVEDLASYDSSHDNGDGTMGCYMLDAGDYDFSLRTDSHTVVSSVSASLASQHFFCGDNKRSSDDQAAYNQFDEDARGEYLSRNDGFANYASAMNSVSDTIKSTDYINAADNYDSSYDSFVTKNYVEGIDYAANGDLTLNDMVGLDYDDPKWDELLNQLTIDEMKSLVTDTMFTIPEVDSINKSAISDSDGPLGISSMFSTSVNSVSFPAIPLLAATFNQELANEYGQCMADQAHETGVSGWYAPAMNIHRSAFSGRNYEYYSEDPFLAASTAAAEVGGARSKGLITYIKHFALNDEESDRASLHVYSNEQAIRETYLKPFEAAVKDGGSTAVMTAMDYVNDEFCGANEALLTEVLRNEWGFRGVTLSDVDEGGEAAQINTCLRAGLDNWLIFQTSGNLHSDTNADIYYLRRAAHDTLYAEANAAVVGSEVLDWSTWARVIEVSLGILAATCAVAAVRNASKRKKDESPKEEAA